MGTSNDEPPGTPKMALSRSTEYPQIIEIIKECDADNWGDILQNFEREKVTDKAMGFLDCDPKDDSQEIWKDLLPQLGVRVMFKTKWNDRIRTTTTAGMDTEEEGPVSPTLQTVASDEGVS